MAGARALWRATGMTDDDFGKPIVAIANSYTQFVPGHVHLKDMGGIVADAIAEAGGVGREFNTIAVDDGIAMGHGGMLYSLPSRELIADAVEYMVNAHCADALVCISNCDKITPGMVRTHRDTAGDDLFISRPVIGRVTREWSVQFVRKLFDASGRVRWRHRRLARPGLSVTLLHLPRYRPWRGAAAGPRRDRAIGRTKYGSRVER